MQKKTMLSIQVVTRIIPSKLILLIVLTGLASGLFAQEQDALSFVDSLTNIITQQKAQSAPQKETVATLRKRMLFELKNNKNLSKADRTFLWVTIRKLELKKEAYTALIPKNEISEEVLAYEEKLQELKDSIAYIQQQLIAAIEDPSNNNQTKEKAVNVLAGIHNEEVLRYLLKNEERLRFGAMNPLNSDIYDEEATRTAMSAILNEYLSESEVNWMVFPFILKYVETAGLSEIGLIRQLYGGYENEHYQNSWYLLKFMQANANPALKTIIEGELRIVENPEERK
jgi:hypothetical protein